MQPRLSISNGDCTGVRGKASPQGFGDRIEVFTANIPGAFNAATTAYNTASGGVGARIKALETYLSSVGLLPAGTVA